MSFYHSLESYVRVLSLTTVFSGVVSCSPMVYEVAVEVRSGSEYAVDLHGVPPSIVSICERRDAGSSSLDSALASKVAFGLAEKLEKDLSLQDGDIPVFTFYSDEMDVSDIDNVKYLLTNAGSDRVLVLDSLRTGDFTVHPAESYREDVRFLVRTDVTLPFSLKVNLFALDSLLYGKTPSEKSFSIDQYLKWTLVSSDPVEQTRAISTVMGSLSRAFSDLGEEIGAGFSPQWNKQVRSIVAYDMGEWSRAYLYASDFKWDKALAVWMKLADGRNAENTSYAAYNAAVACEMMGRFELAQQWLDLARSYYVFGGISEEQQNIDRGRKNMIKIK